MNTDLKVAIKAKGWSYRKVAKLLRVNFRHIDKVANGHRKSKRLERRIANLPDYQTFIKIKPDFFDKKNTKRKIRNFNK